MVSAVQFFIGFDVLDAALVKKESAANADFITLADLRECKAEFEMQASISQLNVFPVKACRGLSLDQALVTKRGFEHDRSLLLIAPDGTAITQRDFPALCLVSAQVLDSQTVKLCAPGKSELVVRRINSGITRYATVWSDECEAVDQGEEAALWFSDLIGNDCRLVAMKDDFVRPVDPEYATGMQEVGFADGFPFLMISEASLADLNSKLEIPVPMDRFRPNLVVRDCEAFAEDRWKKIRIAGIEFDVVKPCARCVVTTIDQDHAVKGREPLRTLAAYRSVDNKVMFGQNLVHHGLGPIKVGDLVEVIE